MNFFFFLDPVLLLPVIGLSTISLALIASTANNLFLPQFLYFVIGFLCLIIFSSIDNRIWKKLNWYIYGISIMLLLVTFLGPQVRGATRWIELGLFRFQSSEFVKPMFIIFLANFFSQMPKGEKKYLFSFLLLLPLLLLIFKQPDLGNVLVYVFIFVSITVISGLAWRYVILSGLILLFILPLFWNLLLDYQKLRLISFLNPQLDPVGTGYNALQAIIAIGSGKLFGFGLGKGTQSNLLFLPEYHTDFVFASLVEELGFVGGAISLIFYLLILMRIIAIGNNSSGSGKYLACGIFAQFFIQLFINIGMNLGILPITGITLPLLSYGGSSIISSFISLGIVLSLVKNKRGAIPLVIR